MKHDRKASQLKLLKIAHVCTKTHDIYNGGSKKQQKPEYSL